MMDQLSRIVRHLRKGIPWQSEIRNPDIHPGSGLTQKPSVVRLGFIERMQADRNRPVSQKRLKFCLQLYRVAVHEEYPETVIFIFIA